MITSFTPARRRLAAALTVALCGGIGVAAASTYGAENVFPDPVPRAVCGPGALPETSAQGRVPQADYRSGRVTQGYQCNAVAVSKSGTTGGFKVQRYTDAAGNTCGFYDSTAILPKDVLAQLGGAGLGVVVLDMNDPARPRKTANLVTPAMLSPHESLLVNQERGILGAVMGSPATQVGIVDLYDVRTDCRHPKLLSSTPTGILGHESGWAPDGKTFWVTGAVGTLVAIDTTDPRRPKRIFQQFGVIYHGLRLSDDGRTMYVANIGIPSATEFSTGGLRILDVSQVQDRKANPKLVTLSDVTWRERSIPQAAEPFTRDGHRYVLETDEFANFSASLDLTQPDAEVGAARIINVDDPRAPYVVSNLRLEVHQPEARAGEQKKDPGAIIPVGGYTGHYCAVPSRHEPRVAACSMGLSGLRVFDLSDLEAPREAAYFNRPIKPLANLLNPLAVGALALSQPTFDVARRSVWFTDANSGLYVVRLTNGVEKLLEPATTAAARKPAAAQAEAPAEVPAPVEAELPATAPSAAQAPAPVAGTPAAVSPSTEGQLDLAAGDRADDGTSRLWPASLVIALGLALMAVVALRRRAA